MADPVPQWNQLPKYAQNDLVNWKDWFISNQSNAERRLSLLNTYSKLKRNNLWQFVKGPSKSERFTNIGCITLILKNVENFKKELWGKQYFPIKPITSPGELPFMMHRIEHNRRCLTRPSRSCFTRPSTSLQKWTSREHQYYAALHFKHDSDWGHAPNEVQVHIDHFGSTAALGAHLFTLDDYKEVYKIRNLLRDQGHDGSLLFGMSSMAHRLTPIPPTTTGRSSTISFHTIRYGDRVWHLADDYGYKNRKQFVDDVLGLNPGIDFTRLRPRQVIKVPNKTDTPKLSLPYTLREKRINSFSPKTPNLLQQLGELLGRSPSHFEPSSPSGSQHSLQSQQSFPLTHSSPQLDQQETLTPHGPNLLQQLGEHLDRSPSHIEPYSPFGSQHSLQPQQSFQPHNFFQR